jgi:hypothetical protein
MSNKSNPVSLLPHLVHMKMEIFVTTVFDVMILAHVFVLHSAVVYVARSEDWDRVFH